LLIFSKELVDCTQPELSEKELTNYIIDCKHIHAEAPPDYTNFNKRLAIGMLLQASRSCSNPDHPHSTPTSEPSLVNAIIKQESPNYSKPTVTRLNFSTAFDAVAEAPSSTLGSHTYNLAASSFDREFSILVTDLAPYVRSIAAYDLRLEAERLRDSSLLSAGGRGAKKLRMTRVARSAALGGKRENTRRERWFDQNVNLVKVMETGGKEWAGMGISSADEEGSLHGESAEGSVDSEQIEKEVHA
jgi:hypothetical protein